MPSYKHTRVPFESLKGKTFTKVTDKEGDGDIDFISDKYRYSMYHQQDCCESVYLDDICGDLSDLENTPILLAEEIDSDYEPEGFNPDHYECYNWTFYKISTIKGSVTLRWFGSSNGYYSTEANLYEMKRVDA
jgi:hypothetical protein